MCQERFIVTVSQNTFFIDVPPKNSYTVSGEKSMDGVLFVSVSHLVLKQCCDTTLFARGEVQGVGG